MNFFFLAASVQVPNSRRHGRISCAWVDVCGDALGIQGPAVQRDNAAAVHYRNDETICEKEIAFLRIEPGLLRRFYVRRFVIRGEVSNVARGYLSRDPPLFEVSDSRLRVFQAVVEYLGIYFR